MGLRYPVLGKIRLEFLLAVAASLLALTRGYHGSRNPGLDQSLRRQGSNADLMFCVIAFLGVLLLSTPLAVVTDVAWNDYINRVVKFAWIGLLIPQFVVSPSTLRLYLSTNLLAFLKIGEEGFIGKITGGMVWENQGVPRLFGTQGSMFGDPNALSGKNVSLLPFIWYLYPIVKNRWMKYALILMVIFAINIIVFTASRTGYLALIFAALLFLIFSNKNTTRLTLSLVAVSLLAVAVTPPAYKERFMSSFTGKEAEGHSALTRKELFFDSLNAFKSQPLGLGLGNFSLYQARHGRNAQDTHNLYTQLLAETGIQGFIFFFILIFVTLNKTFKIRRSYKSLLVRLENARSSLSGELAALADTEISSCLLLHRTATALIVFVLIRLALGLLGHDLMEIYWWFAAGLTMALNKMRVIADSRASELLRKPHGSSLTQ